MQIDRPEIVAEVSAVVEAYESALMNNRGEELIGIFWNDPRTIRFGMTEMLFGIDAIREFRRTVRAYAQRVRQRVQVTTFGTEFATTNIVYERIETGAIGRETKIMARVADPSGPHRGWRVVSAHVSLVMASDPGTKRL